jgi:hypothetical protein
VNREMYVFKREFKPRSKIGRVRERERKRNSFKVWSEAVPRIRLYLPNFVGPLQLISSWHRRVVKDSEVSKRNIP